MTIVNNTVLNLTLKFIVYFIKLICKPYENTQVTKPISIF